MKVAATIALACCVAFAGFLAYIGYFGGAVFVPVPATTAPAPQRQGLAAVLLSGDMGFKLGLGPPVAERIAAHGIPVIGVNSLVYFRQQRTPREVESLIAEAIARALAFGHASKVVLIGQSFGSDMISVGLATLPQPLRDKLLMVALVVPTDTLYLRASPSELFGWTRPDGDPVPGGQRLTWLPVTCISGKEDTESLCPQIRQPNVRWTVLPGDHFLNRDADAVARVLLVAIDHAASDKAAASAHLKDGDGRATGAISADTRAPQSQSED